MERVLYLLIILLPLGQLGRMMVWPDLRIQVNDILVILATLLFLTRINFGDFFAFVRKWKWMALFLVVAFFSWLVNLGNYTGRENFVGFLYFLRYFTYWVFFFAVSSYLARSKSKKKIGFNILKYLTIAGLIVCVFGFFQYLCFGDLGVFGRGEWDPHLGRLAGSFFDPGFASGILILFLILLFTLYLSTPLSRSFIWRRRYLILCIILAYLAMLLTYSRSGYFMYIAAVFIISYLFKNFKFLAGAVLIFAISLILLPKSISYGTKIARSETILARFENWSEAVKIFEKKPFLGVGFNNLKYARIKYGNYEKEKILKSNAAAGVDNSFLFVLATTGILGFVVFTIFWIDLVIKLFCFLRQGSNFNLAVGILALVVVVCSLGQSLFINNLFYPFYLEWIIFILIVKEAEI